MVIETYKNHVIEMFTHTDEYGLQTAFKIIVVEGRFKGLWLGSKTTIDACREYIDSLSDPYYKDMASLRDNPLLNASGA